MLLIAELLHQTAVVCNSIAASHHAETAGEHLERRYATVGKAAALFANNACEGGSSGHSNCPKVFYLKWTAVFAFDRPPPTAVFFKHPSGPPALLQRWRRLTAFMLQLRLHGLRQERPRKHRLPSKTIHFFSDICIICAIRIISLSRIYLAASVISL